MPTAAGEKTPGMSRRGRGMGRQDRPVSGRDAKTEGKEPGSKFGAVKVHAGLLSQALDVKTYVITNTTSAKELISIVINSYKVLCLDHKPFYLSLERLNCKPGANTQRVIKLHETAKPLEMQARYPRGDTKFNLQLRPGCGVLSVNDKSVVSKNISRSAFVSDQTTCAQLIKLILKTNKLDSQEDKYAVYEVEVNSKLSQELRPKDRPLLVQKQRLDSFEYFFQVREKKDTTDQKIIRRNHSLEDLSRGPKKVLNYKELKKSLIPRRKQWNRPTSGDLSKSCSVEQLTSGIGDSTESTLTKLKDSVSKLRKHLDNISQRRLSLPEGENIMSDLSDDTGAFAGGNKSFGRSVSHDCLPYEERNGFRSASRDSMRQEEVTGYETGSSMNESDAGSGPGVRKMRGSYDSAYSSGRVSHSSQYRNRRKKPTHQDSGESSPEGLQSLTKSQSLIDLKSSTTPDYRGITRPRPTRINYTPDTMQKSRDKGGSEGNLNSWSRMKLYDTNRRSQNGPGWRQGSGRRSGEEGEAPGVKEAVTPEDGRSVSPTSSTGRSRTRRTLPQVPTSASGHVLEERKKRMSAAALIKARMDKERRESVEGWLGSSVQASSPTKSIEDADYHPDYRRQTSTPAGGKDGSLPTPAREPPPPYAGKSTFKPVALPADSGPPSQTALKRIISDLRDAAYKPIDSQQLDAPRARDKDDTLSRSSDSSLPLDPEPPQMNTTYEKRRSSLEMALNPTIPNIMETAASQNYEQNGYITNPVGNNTFTKHPRPESLPDSQTGNSHPSLKKIISCCELVEYDIARDVINSRLCDFGIELFDSSFSETDSQDVDGLFRAPGGRKALIGRGRGAFQPVQSNNSDSNQPSLSLASISHIREGSEASRSNLRDGDYIVEVNGHMVNQMSAEMVINCISRTDNTLHLVIGRRKSRPPSTSSSGTRGSVDTDIAMKDYEKLKLKYQSLKQDAEKHMDLIAELRLDLQDKDRRVEDINQIITRKDEHIFRAQLESKQKEEKISEWKLEANNRNIEIARLKFEGQQREMKIEQLRKLLIQQSEVMNLDDNGFGDYDEFYEGEHVSAV